MSVTDEMFDRGQAMRRRVLGDEHVDRSLRDASEFARPLQDLVTTYCWGATWGRPGLPPETRSLLNLVMLTAMDRQHELGLHIKGALNNGCTVDEIREALLQTAVYCGVPAAIEAFRTAEAVLGSAAGSAGPDGNGAGGSDGAAAPGVTTAGGEPASDSAGEA
jgi:4-carboxymuconolactone decarboxylase